MSTRFYLANATPAFSPTSKGGWAVSFNTTQALATAPTGSSAVQNNTQSNTSPTGTMLEGIFVTAALPAAVTITGTVTWCAAMANNNSFFGPIVPAIYGWVSAGTTSTVRGTLFSLHQSATALSTTAQGITDTAITVSSVSAQIGDCIVIEIGSAYPNGSSNQGAALYYGGTGTTDLTAGDTTTGHNGWVQFSTTIIPIPSTAHPRVVTSRAALVNSYSY